MVGLTNLSNSYNNMIDGLVAGKWNLIGADVVICYQYQLRFLCIYFSIYFKRSLGFVQNQSRPRHKQNQIHPRHHRTTSRLFRTNYGHLFHSQISKSHRPFPPTLHLFHGSSSSQIYKIARRIRRRVIFRSANWPFRRVISRKQSGRRFTFLTVRCKQQAADVVELFREIVSSVNTDSNVLYLKQHLARIKYGLASRWLVLWRLGRT